MINRLALAAGVAASTAVLMGGVANAADPPPAGATSTLTEVVVTAQRRSESLQKVPVAITAFTQQQLTEKSITNVYDLNNAVPGLTVQADSGSGNRANFAIRGRGQNYGAAAGSVETYFADVPLSPPYEMPGPSVPFYDLQSVQVLKGPQGTLFGRSTTGGAVLVVPQAPSDQLGGYLRLQGGDYADFQAEGAINLPIVADKVELRLAGFVWTRDGYSHTLGGRKDDFGVTLPSQSYNNENVREGRATLTLRPTDELSNTTIVAYHWDNNRATPAATAINPFGFLEFAALFAPPCFSTVEACYPNLLHLGPYKADINVNLDHLPTTNLEVVNTTTYNLTGNLVVKNIFGYVEAHGITNQAADTDGTPASGIDLVSPSKTAANYQYTDEIQLQGHNFDNRLTWLVGGLADLTREPGGDKIDLYTTDVSNLGGLSFSSTWEQNTYNDYGVFASGTFKITDKLSFAAGFRHSWYEIEVKSISYDAGSAAQYLANASLSPAGAIASGQIKSNPFDNVSSFQGNTYNVGLEYQATSGVMVYGGYRRGFKPGGFNPRAPQGLSSFAPETDDDMYAGVKTRFNVAGMAARVNVEGYWDLYQNKQVSNLLPYPGTLVTVTSNVPAVTYRGLDADVSVDVTGWLRLDANYSYIDAFNTKWPDISCLNGSCGAPNLNLDLKHNPVAFVSPNKVSISARLHAALPDDKGDIAIIPTVNYEDKWYSFDNATLLPEGTTVGLHLPTNFNVAAAGPNAGFVPAYTTVNLRLEWNHMMGSKVDAAIAATNLTNTVVSFGPTATLNFGSAASDFGPPRMVTVELSTKF
jgi:iron complex outermembrane receptor protein